MIVLPYSIVLCTTWNVHKIWVTHRHSVNIFLFFHIHIPQWHCTSSNIQLCIFLIESLARRIFGSRLSEVMGSPRITSSFASAKAAIWGQGGNWKHLQWLLLYFQQPLQPLSSSPFSFTDCSLPILSGFKFDFLLRDERAITCSFVLFALDFAVWQGSNTWPRLRKTLNINSMAFVRFDPSTVIRAQLIMDISELSKLEKVINREKKHGTPIHWWIDW